MLRQLCENMHHSRHWTRPSSLQPLTTTKFVVVVILLLTAIHSRACLAAVEAEESNAHEESSSLVLLDKLRASSSSPLKTFWDDIGTTSKQDTQGIKPCSYQALKDAFPPPSTATTTEQKEGCWKLREELIQIPIEAITNRDSLFGEAVLDYGRNPNGIVVKGILSLQQQKNGASSVCSVALKTDKCRSNSPNVKGGKSCLEKDTTFMKDSRPYEEQGILAALVSVAARKAGVALPGMMPTWGVIVDHQQELSSTTRIVAGVLPLVEFVTIDDIWARKVALKDTRPAHLAALIQPMTQAMSFVQQLGMAFQDVWGKNYGIDERKQQHGFIYDTAYLGFVEDMPCSLTGQQAAGCNFCPETVFSPNHRESKFRGDMIQRKDCRKFTKILSRWLREYGYQKHELYFLLDFFSVQDDECVLDDLEDVLKQYIASQTQPRLPFLMEGDYEATFSYQLESKSSGEEGDVPVPIYSNTTDILVQPDGSLISISTIPSQRRQFSLFFGPQKPRIVVSFAQDIRGPWVEREINIPSSVKTFESASLYVATNGTITMVLDTFVPASSTKNATGLTIVTAKGGCTEEQCDNWSIVGSPNVLEIPRYCFSNAVDEENHHCGCSIRHPTIWYDEAIHKWRMLFDRYPSIYKANECSPQLQKYEIGYAESAGSFAGGPWKYFDSPISDQGHMRPKVILNSHRSLDGGYVLSASCEAAESNCIAKFHKVLQSALQDGEEPMTLQDDAMAEEMSRWDTFSDQVRAAWEVLGYTREMWIENEEPNEKEWHELSEKELEAATFLGFNEDNWELEGEPLQVPERAFEVYKHAFPCFPRNETVTTEGFFYVKIPKTAGTTVAGVVRHLVAHKEDRFGFRCNIRSGHVVPRKQYNYSNRNPAKSFLWSFVRDPAERFVSSFFYHAVTKTEKAPTFENFLQWADGHGRNYQSDYLRLDNNLSGPAENVQAIMKNYDFIGLTERLEESLVALMMILDLDIRDILYLSSKRSGYAFTGDGKGNVFCVNVAKKTMLPEMNDFLVSSEWKERNKEDILLYKAVNQSLDLTIDKLGRETFERNLQDYRYALKVAKEECQAHAVFPCTADGEVQSNSNCYARDEGCGYECLDELSPSKLNPPTSDVVLSRPFPIYDYPFPCVPAADESDQGFFYVKIPKTAGTTVAGVARHIAHHQALGKDMICNIRAGHESPRSDFLNYKSRDKTKSFLWSFVRDPAERLISSFFYHSVTKRGEEPSFENLKRWARQEGKSFQADYLRLGQSSSPEQNIKSILDEYDFIGVTERLDESLVVLMMILRLDISDILYLSSKRSGYAFTGDGKGNVYCVKLAQKEITPEMIEYFSSSEWKEMNEEDYLLYSVANHSLDLTIEALGRSEFVANLQAYRQAIEVAKMECQNRSIPPCGPDGTLNLDNNCYARDEGCGHQCLDELVAKSMIATPMSMTPEKSPEKKSIEPEKRIAWLLSFPNSGTTYTLEVVSNVSNIDFATNYGKETKLEEASIFPGGQNATGPFWFPNSLDRPEEGAILTKTHCEGRCVDCPPEQWLLTQDEFERGCCRYARLEDVGKRKLYYDISLVDRAVHLIRNPFDNIVSRFHHERNPHFKQGARGLYENSPAGFRKFCKERVDHLTVDPDDSDEASSDSKPLPPIDERLWNMLKGVPCHTDFVRYIRWHNLAFEMLKSNNISSLVVHYENYGSAWNETVSQILSFLGQPPKDKPSTDFRSKSYPDYFEPSEVEAVKHVFKSLSSETSWSNIEQYLEIKSDAIEAPLCTYDALKENFPRNSRGSSGECWRLEDEILIIPLEAIVNKDSMELLGTGSKGVVHKGLVRLGGERHCSIAIKTDRCKNEKTNKRFRSCLEEGTVLMKNAQSFMEAEYMGALLFLAMKKAGIELPGLLPTFGIVTNSHPEIHQDQDTHWLDSTSAGILMPIIKFEAMDEIWKGSKVVSQKNPYEMATLMLPVIEALLFIENLGASFQDVQGKNIGIYADSQLDAFIYDNTFLALLQGETCNLNGRQKEACNFCFEDIFSTTIREPGHTTAMVRRKDCQELLSSVIRTLREYNHGNHELTIDLDMLQHSGEKCEIGRIETLLQGYVSSQSLPRLPFILSPPITRDSEDFPSEVERRLLLEREKGDITAALVVNSDASQTEFSTSNGKVKARIFDPTSNVTVNQFDLKIPREVGRINGLSAFAEKNGTTTIVLDACDMSLTSNATSCFTTIQARDGCSLDSGCSQWSVVGRPNIVTLPEECFLGGCSCRADQPTIWFDKPMGKWRMLFRQFPMKQVENQCVDSPEYYEHIGGYAETKGFALAGPWKYVASESAYSTLVKTRFSGREGTIDKVASYPYRSRPQVVLNDKGGLEGGYLMTNICDLKNDGSDQCIRDGWIVQQVWQSTIWSKEAGKVHKAMPHLQEIVAPHNIQGQWDNLPEEVRDAWLKLGHSKDLWDEGDEPDYKSWEDLNSEERIAAHELGFERSSWEESSE